MSMVVLNIVKQKGSYYVCPNTKKPELHQGLLTYNPREEQWELIRTEKPSLAGTFTEIVELVRRETAEEYEDEAIVRHITL